MPVTTTLPVDMQAWIEQTTQSTVTSATRQAGGGRNEGWLVELAGDGGEQRAVPAVGPLRSRRTGDPWTVRREAEVYRALDTRPCRPPDSSPCIRPSRRCCSA